MSDLSKSNLVLEEKSHFLNRDIPEMLHQRNPNEFCHPLRCNWPFGLCIIRDCVVVNNFSSIVLLNSHSRFHLPYASSDDESNNLQFMEQCLQEEISHRLEFERREFHQRVMDENIFRRFTDVTALLKSPKFCESKFINIGDVLFSEPSESSCGADDGSLLLHCHETLDDEGLLQSVSSNSLSSVYEEVVETSQQTVGDDAAFEDLLLAEADHLESLVNRGGIKEWQHVGDGTAEYHCGTLSCGTLSCGTLSCGTLSCDTLSCGTLSCPSGDSSESNAESSVSVSQTSSCDCSSSLASSQTVTSDEAVKVQTAAEFSPRRRADLFRVGKGKRKANMRERKRIKNLGAAFTDLRRCIPKFKYHCKQISQLEILREAANYIQQLLALLDGSIKPSLPAAGGFTGSVRSRLFRCLANSKVISSEPIVYAKDDYNTRGTKELISDSLVPMDTDEQLMLPMNVSCDNDDNVVGSGSSPVSPSSFDCSSIGLYDDLSVWFPAYGFFFAGDMADEVPASDCGF